MRTVRVRTRVACVVGAMALLFPFAPAMAASGDDHNRPVDVTFTKWGVTAPPLPAPQPPFGLLEGFAGDGPVGSFVGEVLWRQVSLNGHVVGLDGHVRGRGRGPFVHGAHPGRAECDGRGPLRRRHPGGWRAGARVQVVYQRYLAIVGMPSCVGAPDNKTCFVGTIHVDRAPRD